MIGTNRPHMGIIADILTVAKKPSIQNRIIHECSLSYPQYSSLIFDLIIKGLITKTLNAKSTFGRATIVYLTTDKGREFIEQYNMLLTLLEGENNNDKA